MMTELFNFLDFEKKRKKKNIEVFKIKKFGNLKTRVRGGPVTFSTLSLFATVIKEM